MRSSQPRERVTRGFSMGEDGETGDKQSPRRVRTRAQIMNGEGKRPPATVELKLLAGNPFNPRDELTEIEETAESLRVRGQIQPVTVVRRAAFLNAHPGQEGELGEEAEYVVIDGNRRLAAAPLAGLEELRIDVNDDLAVSDTDILESALIANIHRVDVAPIDQARAIQQLLAKHGTQEEVARRLGKTGAWVSQRLALLGLPEELQEKVESGELKVKDGRRIGRLPKDQQHTEAEKAINRVKAPRRKRGSSEPAAGTEVPHQASGPAGALNPVNAQTTTDSVPVALNPVKAPEQAAAEPEGLNPVNASPAQDRAQPRQLPYDDALYVVQHMHVKMTTEGFVQGARVWMRILREQHPEAYSALLQELAEQEQQPV
ncbi:ParB/RepB/Spo0J family partition protein [Streptomyces sp. NPDC004232]|uniref:ParB/RepB/Spo0J family partition protein n=1 Tax=Streptomyces sp. NPDC004232 TaxID=3154454 RepID=UPI0033A42CAC